MEASSGCSKIIAWITWEIFTIAKPDIQSAEFEHKENLIQNHCQDSSKHLRQRALQIVNEFGPLTIARKLSIVDTCRNPDCTSAKF